jgi:hypothetical protein
MQRREKILQWWWIKDELLNSWLAGSAGLIRYHSSGFLGGFNVLRNCVFYVLNCKHCPMWFIFVELSFHELFAIEPCVCLTLWSKYNTLLLCYCQVAWLEFESGVASHPMWSSVAMHFAWGIYHISFQNFIHVIFFSYIQHLAHSSLCKNDHSHLLIYLTFSLLIVNVNLTILTWILTIFSSKYESLISYTTFIVVNQHNILTTLQERLSLQGFHIRISLLC